jgi:two-component system phosphate regulon sensor histidine kinase PhoR
MTLAAMAVLSLYITIAVKHIYIDRVISDLTVRTRLMSHEIRCRGLLSDTTAVDRFCKEWGHTSATRYTVILPDGTVIGDTRKDPAKMENHRFRPEISAARHNGTGHSVRFSHTLGLNLVYVAIPLTNNRRTIAFVRASVPVDTVAITIALIRNQIYIGLAVAAVLFAIIGIVISRLISRPLENVQQAAEKLAKGDLSARVLPEGSAETTALATTINHMADELQSRMRIITRQQSELNAVFSSMSEGLLALDFDMKIIHINQTAKNWFGLRGRDCTGCPLSECIRIFDFTELVHRMTGNNCGSEAELTLNDDPQNRIHLRVRSSKLIDKSGWLGGIVLVMSDITRRKQLENMRRRFVADVSHELKTPLTAIMGAVETMHADQQINSGPTVRFLQILERQSSRMQRIVKDLLSLAAIEYDSDRGAIELKPEPLAPLLRHVAAAYRENAAGAGHRLELEIDCNPTAEINAPLLEDAISNLLDNAIKYSSPGSSVTLALTADTENTSITVCDEGPGIESQHLPHLFQRFYRIDKARSREAGGTGLGLAIVKHIIMAHHGQVSVESTPGSGSCFTIILPLKKKGSV